MNNLTLFVLGVLTVVVILLHGRVQALETNLDALETRVQDIVNWNEFVHGVSIDVAGPINKVI